MVRPSVLVVCRFITSSNFVDCSTERSVGFAPFRILSTKVTASWKRKTALCLTSGPRIRELTLVIHDRRLLAAKEVIRNL